MKSKRAARSRNSWLTRLLQHELFATSPLNPLAWLAAVLLLGSVGLLACYWPALRAANVYPMAALRCD